MSHFWGRFLANIAGLIVISFLFSNSVIFHGAWSFILAALVLGLVNAYIRPIVRVLALPLTIITFGLFAVVVNFFCLWLVHFVTSSFELNGCFFPMIAALVQSIVSAFASQIIGVEQDE